jgi:hypothetical protein
MKAKKNSSIALLLLVCILGLFSCKSKKCDCPTWGKNKHHGYLEGPNHKNYGSIQKILT